MVFDTYHIIYLLANFFTIFVIYRFMRIFFESRRCNRTLNLLSYLLYFVATSLFYFWFNIPLITLIINLITMFMISLTYEASIQKRIIYVIYMYLFMAVAEIITAAMTGYVYFSVFSQGDYRDSFGVIAVRIVIYGETLLLENIKLTKNGRNIGWIFWLASIMIPVSTLILEVIIANQTNLTKVEAVGSVSLLFAVNIIAFYLYDSLAENYIKKSKLALLQKENELYSRQCEIMQSSTEDLQAFRHDMSNQLIILNHLLEEGKDEEARRQLDQLSRFIKGKVIYSTSGNIIIDGLVNYKLQSVASENIKVETEIVVPKQLNIDIADFVTLLGNLLDNALEALKKVDREQRILTIKIMFSQERLIGRITNTYCGEIYLKDDKILTSKKEKQKHGYGLSNVEKIIKKYNGYMEIDYANWEFRVDFIIYLPQKN
ncbi:sensor histidine kinase [Mediterraneibacter faecis]|uniref:sensor histidine kinase n=1 Tax=Mediterraneibacter faecis TaxID=592978 RepID=UPI0015F50C0D|nr:sensor histidine kinase [Mediterraneibacter faecis]